MGIEIITSEVKLSPQQKGAITRFVRKNCSYYYFLNFIRITKGNVKDAIKLYYFDEELRSIILKYILRLEVQMKKDFVECVEKSTNDDCFWNNSKYYIPSFVSSNKKKKSKFRILVDSIDKTKYNMNYSLYGPENDRALYSSTFGNFIKIFQNIKYKYKIDFEKKYLSHDTYSNELIK